MWATLTKQWFLTALAICFAVGYLAAERLQPLLEASWIRSCVVFVVMGAMGITLKAETIRHSLANPLPSALASLINIAVVPLMALSMRWWLPEALFGGLFVAAIVPCTLASASVWTRKADGDDSVAMMTTVITNLACVIVVPLGIWLVLSEQAQIDARAQIGKLATVVVAPLVVAQILRRLGCQRWADRQKKRLSVMAQCGILVMVIFGAAASGHSVGDVSGELSSGWIVGIGLVLAAVGIHLATLAMGVMAARGFGLNRARQIAVGIAGSQKTLMVGLQIAIDCGVSVVPMLIYHLGQLTLDTLIAQRWKLITQRQTPISRGQSTDQPGTEH